METRGGRAAHGVPRAAPLRDGGPTIAFFCEYDALEELGHGCGHNIIAAAGLGAGLLAADWLMRNAEVGGRVVVVGSPGEEGGGGKVFLIDGGCLEGIDAAMMIHPAGDNLSRMTTLARAGLDFTFKGRAAHAGLSPERGINALDAAVLTLNAIGLLRQQLPPDAQVHAVITRGGDAPNIIPEIAAIRAYVRAPTIQTLEENVKPRVENCARGAALATGAKVDIKPTGPTYASLRPNRVLGDLMEGNFHRVCWMRYTRRSANSGPAVSGHGHRIRRLVTDRSLGHPARSIGDGRRPTAFLAQRSAWPAEAERRSS